MSRIGKRPVVIPDGIKINMEANTVVVQGPKGQLTRIFPKEILIDIQEKAIIVNPKHNDKQGRSLHGLCRTLISNMIEGVNKGFTKSLEISGVGYKIQMQGNKLVLNMGYSHPVEFNPPEGIKLAVEGVNKIIVQGIDKELVGNTAAKIREIRKVEPYKGKGIRYTGEKVRRKVGKAKK